MKIALMQPYLFPYFGYYQLAYAVDEFIFFDDVNFTKKGFISRNSIQINGITAGFSLPVINKSQNRRINDHQYTGEYNKFLQMIYSSYVNSPYFSDVFPLIEEVLFAPNRCVAEKNAFSIRMFFEYLELQKKFSFSSELAIGAEIRAQARVIEVCKAKNAQCYINSIGGLHLYEAKAFLENRIKLKFLESGSPIYDQNLDKFVPSLSIIDMLMWSSRKEILGQISNYRLLDASQMETVTA